MALDDLPTVKPSVLVMLVPFETLFKVAATVSKREELERNKRQGKEHRPPRRASTARKATTRKIKKKEKKKKVDEDGATSLLYPFANQHPAYQSVAPLWLVTELVSQSGLMADKIEIRPQKDPWEITPNPIH